MGARCECSSFSFGQRRPPCSAAHITSGWKAYTSLIQDAFDHYPNDQFQSFEQYAAAQFNTQSAFPGPPTPPNQHPAVQPHPHHDINGASAVKLAQADGLPISATKVEPNLDIDRRQGSNSGDDEDLTPAQSRRKAQNRAA